MTERYRASDYTKLMATRTASGRSLSDIAAAAIEKAAKSVAPPKAARAGWNKYGAKKVRTEDGVFDSKIEYRRWLELKQLQAAGVIVNLERQVVYEFHINGVRIGKLTADYRWQEVSTGETIVEDVKGGVISRDFPLRKKLLLALYGIDIKIWPERKKRKKAKSLSS